MHQCWINLSFINTVCKHHDLVVCHSECFMKPEHNLIVFWHHEQTHKCKPPPQISCYNLSFYISRGKIQVEVTTSNFSKRKSNTLTHVLTHSNTHHLPHTPLGAWLSSLVEGRAMTSFWYCDWKEKILQQLTEFSYHDTNQKSLYVCYVRQMLVQA